MGSGFKSRLTSRLTVVGTRASRRVAPLGSLPHLCHVDSGWGLRGVEWLV